MMIAMDRQVGSSQAANHARMSIQNRRGDGDRRSELPPIHESNHLLDSSTQARNSESVARRESRSTSNPLADRLRVQFFLHQSTLSTTAATPLIR